MGKTVKNSGSAKPASFKGTANRGVAAPTTHPSGKSMPATHNPGAKPPAPMKMPYKASRGGA